MPGVTPTAAEAYAAEHIAGTAFFPIDEIADTSTSLPHMLPSAEAFSAAVSKLGISNGDHIVLYNANGVMGAARVWWTLRAFGHDKVSVLDGGLRKWKAEGKPVTNQMPSISRGNFVATFNPALVRYRDQMLSNIDAKREQVVDARAQARFTGEAPEPRPGLRQGHIPHSRNVDHTSLVDAAGVMKSPADIRGIFEKAGVDLDRPIITSCGSGVTACVLALGLYLAGYKNAAVYDGSWAEWGLPGSLPVEMGIAA